MKEKIEMVQDVVCGMYLIKEYDDLKSKYRGKTYYFCCRKCKEMFDSEPETFISGIHYEMSYILPKPDKCNCKEINNGDK